jgi:hypothetical protein
LIGVTKIDLERRHFSPTWKEYSAKKPLEVRPLYVPTSNVPQGIIRCWLELFEAKDAISHPIVDISPPPPEEMEVRVIVWRAETNVLNDFKEKCNDLYVNCNLGGKMARQTDTHFRARK